MDAQNHGCANKCDVRLNLGNKRNCSPNQLPTNVLRCGTQHQIDQQLQLFACSFLIFSCFRFKKKMTEKKGCTRARMLAIDTFALQAGLAYW